MLKKLSGICLFIIAAALTACGAGAPDEAVKGYVSALYQSDTEKAYEYLSQEDKNTVSLEQFQKSQQDLQDPLFKDFFKNAKIIILEVKENGNKANVTVEQEIPDFAKVIQAGFKIAFNQNLKTDEEKHKAMLDELGGSIPATSIKVVYDAIKEQDEWKVRKPNIFNFIK